MEALCDIMACGLGSRGRGRHRSMAPHAQLLECLQARQGEIADEWYRETSGACHTCLSAAEVRRRLNVLTGQAIVVLLAEPFEAGKAEEIGDALAGLYCLQPEPLGRTLGVLGSQLTAELPAEEMVGLQGNLVGLLEGVSAGFFRRARSMILSEQETIREALVHELQMTEQALRKVHSELELRVARRTAELARVNDELLLEIAERRNAENALREGEEKYRELVEEINDIIYALDPDGTLTYVSPAIESLLGYSREEVEGHPVGRVPGEAVWSQDLARGARATVSDLT
jgi:PAS domain-containing protein